MHTDFTSSYYAKRCFEIPMCLRLVQQLMECGTVAGNSEGNSTSEIALSELEGIKQRQLHQRLSIERHLTIHFKAPVSHLCPKIDNPALGPIVFSLAHEGKCRNSTFKQLNLLALELFF